MKTKRFINPAVWCVMICVLALTEYAGAQKLTVRPAEGGQLEKLLGEDKNKVEELAIEGMVNGLDYNTLWECSFYGNLRVLDLKKAKFDTGDGSQFFVNIPGHAFYNAEVQGDPSEPGFKPVKLEEVAFPTCERVSIGSYAFYGTDIRCLDFTGVTLEDVQQSAFEYSKIRTLRLPCAHDIEKNAFAHTDLEDADLSGAHIRHLGNYAFAGCKNLKNIDLPAVLTTGIGIATGSDICTITFPAEGVFPISEKCFSDNKGLKTLEFSSATTIDADAFEGCGLETIMFDEQMTLLSDSFRNLPTLKTIYCKTQTPPRTLSPFDEQQYPFAGTTPKDATVYVPTGCADIYRNTEGWNYFTNFVETEEFPVLSADMVIGGDTGSVAKSINGGIRLGNNSDETVYRVCSIGGTVISAGRLDKGESRDIRCGAGIYIVRIGERTHKVIVSSY